MKLNVKGQRSLLKSSKDTTHLQEQKVLREPLDRLQEECLQGEAGAVGLELLFEEIDKLQLLVHSLCQHIHGCRKVDDVLSVVVDGWLAVELEGGGQDST